MGPSKVLGFVVEQDRGSNILRKTKLLKERQRTMISPGKLALFFLAFLALSDTACNASAATPAPLPTDAQEAVNKGIIAAKVPDYLLAVRYFQDARKLAPAAPIIYWNLGLAESKLPGRELRAIAWFGAYLAATPNASNAAAVKEQIDMLDVKSQSNLSRFIKSVEAAASQLPSGYDRDHSLGSVAQLWAEAGDLAGAQKTANLIQPGRSKDRALIPIEIAQAEAGDIAGAQELNTMLKENGVAFRQEPGTTPALLR